MNATEVFTMSMDVLAILKARRSIGSSPRTRSDGHHVSLVIEGGGMRGTYVAGMLLALQKAGLTSAFDSIHGSSVGAHLATYFAAGQAEVGRDIFLNEALDPRFISVARVFRGGPMMDVDWMVNEVFAKARRMRLENITPDAPSVHVIATDALTGESVLFDNPGDPQTFFTGLRATAKIPFIAGKAVRFRDKVLTDGGIAQQIAVASARQVGATHMLILTTGTKSRVRKSRASFSHRFERLIVRLLYGEKLAAAFDARRDDINALLDELAHVKGGAGIQGLFVPEGTPPITRLTKERAILQEAALRCEQGVAGALEGN